MMRSRTILASILWLLIAIAMAASAQAGQKKSRRRQVADDPKRTLGSSLTAQSRLLATGRSPLLGRDRPRRGSTFAAAL